MDHGMAHRPARPPPPVGGAPSPGRSWSASHVPILLAAFAFNERVYYRPVPDGAEPMPARGRSAGSADGPPKDEGATELPRVAVPLTTAEILREERLKLSQRIVVHLSLQGRLYDDEIATPAFTQAGMADALGVGQSPLSNTLRRLVLGGVLSQDVRHVRGRPKRLKVYRLTSMGEALAAELRRRDAARLAAFRAGSFGSRPGA